MAKNRVKKEKAPLTERDIYNNKIHNYGRIFTFVALGLIILVPVLYCVAASNATGTTVVPNWSALARCIPFLLGYVAIGLIEAISYAPLLGTGGQYMSFITGNVSNLKLPCAINAQQIVGCKKGSEEEELVTTVAIAVSSIVTTLIVAIGLIPLAIFQSQIVEFLSPLSPYVIPAIFGGLTLILIAQYFKIAIIPFIACIIICVVWNLIPNLAAPSQSVMVIVGMVISGISTFILYKKHKLDPKDTAGITPANDNIETVQKDQQTKEKVDEEQVEEVIEESSEDKTIEDSIDTKESKEE